MIIQLFIAITFIILSTMSIAGTQQDTKQSQSTILAAHSSHKTASSKAVSSILQQATSQRFIVELESPGIATYEGGIKQLLATAPKLNNKVNIQSTAARTYAHFLDKQQTQFVQSLAESMPEAQVKQRFKTLFNGVVVAGNNLSLKQLAAMKNVTSVYQENMYKINTSATTRLIDTQPILTILSEQENDGRGVRIAIIDTGIRPENPMFADDGFTKPTTNMPTDDYCSIADPNFCNNKLIVARWSKPVFPICSDEYMNPLGYISHGSHVAGIAAGNKVSITYNDNQIEISGIAPAAYIMVYKALYSDPTCSVGIGSNIMLINAMEHAVNDGADIINNSWGGNPGGNPDDSAYKIVYEAAEKAGVVVVTAAGNSGDLPKTIGCPACIESGIAVANNISSNGTISHLSSRGPNGDENVLKPDIAAPGSDIISAASPDDLGADFTAMSGTSMASPYVAGAAAIIRQLHPRWSANDIKTALTSTAHNRGIRNGDGSPATPFSMGAGRIDILAAKNAVLTFDKPSIAANSCTNPCKFTRTVYNKTDDVMSLSATATTNSIGMSVSPSNIELKPSEAANFTVTVNATSNDNSPWIFGNLIVASSGHQQAHLPIAVLASATNNEGSSGGSSGGALGWFTLLMLSFIAWRRVRERS